MIDVWSVWYGCDWLGVCLERGSIENINCYIGVMSYVSGECDGWLYCSFYVLNLVFGDLCVGIVKYLMVGLKFKE